jgi:hypothetical protein
VRSPAFTQRVVDPDREAPARATRRSRPLTSSETHDDTCGVPKLTLHPKGYDRRFVPVEGEAFTDAGRSRCH